MPKTVSDLLAARAGHVHLLGICGVGMAGLAVLLQRRGFAVSGCDAARNRLAEWLEARGIAVRQGHAPEHVASGVDWLIRSAAVPDDCAEITAARARGLPVAVRGEVLPALLAGHLSVAVCGTHGKTTTTTFIAQILRVAGRDPSWCIGGEVDALGGVAGTGRGEALVVEADESDGTLARYAPDILVVTNIEPDHMEHFGSEAALEACFASAARQTRRRLVYCLDDPRAARICGSSAEGLSYGFATAAEVTCRDLREGERELRFTLVCRGREAGEVVLPVRGRHNALNAMAAFAVGVELGLGEGEVLAALRGVSLPRRRFDRMVDEPRLLVVSDYAHHPTEIRALVRTALPLRRRRVLAVFQPHRYTRTLALGPEFPAAFAGVDQVVLVPVYAASEPPLRGGTIWDLYAHFRASEAGRASPWALVADSLRAAWQYLRRELHADDLLLVVGAGDVERIAAWAGEEAAAHPPDHPLADGAPRFAPAASAVEAAALQARLAVSRLRLDEPMARHTTLRVGGLADAWAEIGSLADLAEVRRWAAARHLPWRVMGGGSNLLVGDCGVRGVTVRLGGPGFDGIRRAESGVVAAGAGAPLARLLDWLQAEGLSGLEFLEGIPGTVGGAVRMNAGAWNSCIAERLRRVRCLESDGAETTLDTPALKAGYRLCAGIEDRVVLEVGLTLDRATVAEVKERRDAIAARRAAGWRARSAGSIFRNPPGDYAGRLLEQAGLKGATVGGASVSLEHANVIVTREGACGSDVKALMERMRSEVRELFGVALDPEIVEWA